MFYMEIDVHAVHACMKSKQLPVILRRLQAIFSTLRLCASETRELKATTCLEDRG